MRAILFFCLFNLSSLAFSQSTVTYKKEFINMLNSEGKKVGLWKIYNDKNNTVITIDFDKEGEVSFYKDSKLIAVKNGNQLQIFHDSKVTKAYYSYKADNSQNFLDESGNAIDTQIIRYYTQASEALPMFYGGMQSFYSYIGNNFDKKGKVGKVYMQFIIDTDGNVSDLEITSSTNADLNAEAIRVLKNCPRWQPGFQGGNFVKVKFNIPLNITK